jgi:hypothetical protein
MGKWVVVVVEVVCVCVCVGGGGGGAKIFGVTFNNNKKTKNF